MDDQNKNNVPERESNAARRIRLLGIENDDKIHDTSREITKGRFFANLWYKHKWPLIIASFFLVVIISLSATLIYQRVTAPDMSIAYNGPKDLTKAELEKVNELFSSLVPDHTKNGKVEIEWTKNRYLTDEQFREQNDGKDMTQTQKQAMGQAYDQISNMIAYSDYNFLLLDTAVYDEFQSSFYSIVDLFPNEDYSEITYKGCGIYLWKTELARQNPELYSIFPEDTVICIPKLMSKNNDREVALLGAILEYQKSEE